MKIIKTNTDWEFHFYSKCKHKFRSFRHDFWYFIHPESTLILAISLKTFNCIRQSDHRDTVSNWINKRYFLIYPEPVLSAFTIANPFERARFDLAEPFSYRKYFSLSLMPKDPLAFFAIVHTQMSYNSNRKYIIVSLTWQTKPLTVSQFAYLLWLWAEYFFSFLSACVRVCTYGVIEQKNISEQTYEWLNVACIWFNW